MYEVRYEILDVAKALGEETRFAIFRTIAGSSDPLTVKDLVERLSMHHSAIRIHLNKLEDAGLITSQKRHRPGAVGRPQLAFLPNPNAISITLPPRDYRFLARLAMELATRESDADGIDAFGFAWGGDYIRDRGRGVHGPLPLTEAIEVVRREMSDGGAATSVEHHDEYSELLLHNCVFAELAPDFDLAVCTLHQAVLRGMVSQISGERFDWEQTERVCAGDSRCVVRITPRVD